MRRAAIRTLLMLAPVIALLPGAGATPPLGRPGTYAQELAAARREGLPTRPQDLRVPMPPPERNAATYYRRLMALRKAKPLSQTAQAAERLAGRMTLTPTELALVRKALAERRADQALVHRAVACERCVFARDWSKGPYTPFPEFAYSRDAVRMLALEAAVRVAERKPLDAVRTMALGFRIGEHIASDRVLMAHLVAVAVDAIAHRGMMSIAYATGGAPPVLQAVRTAIGRKNAWPDAARALDGEIVTGLQSVELTRREGPKGWVELTSGTGATTPRPRDWRRFADENGAWVLWYYRHAARAVRRPQPERRQYLKALSADLQGREKARDSRVLMAAIIVPVYLQTAASDAVRGARIDCLRAGCEVLLWRAKHGAWPRNLRECMARVPADPFDGKPLRYRREGDGFVIYSVGETGRFDGGTPGVKPKPVESLFRWPKPAYWDAPARRR